LYRRLTLCFVVVSVCIMAVGCANPSVEEQLEAYRQWKSRLDAYSNEFSGYTESTRQIWKECVSGEISKEEARERLRILDAYLASLQRSVRDFRARPVYEFSRQQRRIALSVVDMLAEAIAFSRDVLSKSIAIVSNPVSHTECTVDVSLEVVERLQKDMREMVVRLEQQYEGLRQR